MDDEPKKPLYLRENLTKDLPLVREPEKAPVPELTPEQIDRRLAILDKVGTRLMRWDAGLCITIPIEPNEKVIRALAELRMNLPIMLVKQHGTTAELYYPLLPKGWIEMWDHRGWRAIEEIIRHAVTQMA